jgi:uncharacterized protein YukE
MSEFVRADIGKLESFVTESEEAITEFANIREEFERINNTLLGKWEGSGRSAYKKVADNITEKIGGISDVLNTINDTIVKDIIEKYNTVDKDLAEYNRNPQANTPQSC